MKRLPPQNESGFALIQVMIAVAILGVLVLVFSSLVAQTMTAQRLARIRGERLDLRAIFRGALVCSTQCGDLASAVPSSVGRWNVRLDCANGKQLIVRHPDLEGGTWGALYLPGEAGAMCKRVTPLVTVAKDAASAPDRRRSCPDGETVRDVDFIAQTIRCR